MKYIIKFLVIALISLAGELLNYLIPLPIPGSIYGFVILFVLLLTGVIKVSYIKPVTDFLLDVMPVTFIGPGAALITMLADLKGMFLPVLLAVTVSTSLVIGVTAAVVEKIAVKNSEKTVNGEEI